jgi:chromosome condensin MukBEF ATPase and DNA-binding subunit MukB
MTLHLVSSDARKILRDDSGALDRAATVKQMADHLVAGVMGGLCTANTSDIIQYLKNTPEQYHLRTIFNHMDDALYEAKQTLLAMEMSR